MNLIEKAKEQITALLQSAYAAAAADGSLPAGAELTGAVEIPKDVRNGDYAASHAMAAAKALHAAPRQIAQALTDHMDLSGSWFDSVEIAGPGFLNFRLGRAWYADVLRTVVEEGADYGKSDALSGQKIMVEFVSANPTGPMHMGNARGGVLGDALAQVLYCAGADVWREFYVNDAGNQRTPSNSPRTATTARTSLTWHAASAPRRGTAGWTSRCRSATPPWRPTAFPSTCRR